MTGRGPLRQGGLGRANNPRLELAEPVGDGRVLPVIGLPAYGSAWAAVCARWNVRVTGVGGALSVEVAEVAPVDGYRARGGVRTPANAAIAEAVHAIERRQIAPEPALLGRILQASVAA